MLCHHHAEYPERLQAFDFTGLFTQELMWNHYVNAGFRSSD